MNDPITAPFALAAALAAAGGIAVILHMILSASHRSFLERYPRLRRGKCGSHGPYSTGAGMFFLVISFIAASLWIGLSNDPLSVVAYGAVPFAYGVGSIIGHGLWRRKALSHLHPRDR